MNRKELINLKKIIATALLFMLLFASGACAETKTEEQPSDAAQHTTMDDENKIKGIIYGVFSADDTETLSTEFSCNGGVITVERIAAGLSGWTGLKFRVSVTTDEENKKITVDWLDESSLAQGTMPETPHEEFTFANADEVRIFMFNSLCRSIRENLGDYDVYYTLAGEDISALALDGITSETAFNKTESDIVYVK